MDSIHDHTGEFAIPAAARRARSMRRPQRLGGMIGALLYLYALGAPAADVSVRIIDKDGTPLEDAVVALHAESPAAAAPQLRSIDQVDKQFLPRVLSITTGDAVRFPNSDDIRHHVYSFSPAKTFELPLYHGVPSEPVTFERSGKVVLGCNIHDRMSAHVFVVDTPWHGTAAGGRYTFSGLAAGNYRLSVHHPRHKAADAAHEHPFTLEADATPVFDVTLDLPPLPSKADDLTPLQRKFRALRDDQG